MRWIRGLLGLSQEITLMGGRAPVWWQREMADKMARLDAIHRVSAWIETWITISPMLGNETLFGRSLEKLTNRAARLSESKREEIRAQHPSFTWPEFRATPEWEMTLAEDRVTSSVSRNPETHWASRDQPDFSETPSLSQLIDQVTRPVASRSRRNVPDSSRLETESSEPLLSRLTGNTASGEGSNRPQPQPFGGNPTPTSNASRLETESNEPLLSRLTGNTASGEGSLQPQPFGGSPKPKPNASQLEAEASESLLSRLVGNIGLPVSQKRNRVRLIKETTGPKRNVSVPVPQSPEVLLNWLHNLAHRAGHPIRQHAVTMPPTPRRSSSDQPDFGELLSLSEQWEIPLNGLPASIDLLTRLVAMTVRGEDNSGRELQMEEEPHRSLGITPSYQQNTEQQNTEHTKSEDNQTSGLTPTKDSQATFQPTGARGMEEPRGEEVESSMRIKPPTVTPSLPPLIPSQVLSKEPSPAAAIIQQETTQEVVVTETDDDLDVLAAKIKRILDEEARRHGIDV